MAGRNAGFSDEIPSYHAVKIKFAIFPPSGHYRCVNLPAYTINWPVERDNRGEWSSGPGHWAVRQADRSPDHRRTAGRWEPVAQQNFTGPQ
jgi:hypothetical protein